MEIFLILEKCRLSLKKKSVPLSKCKCPKKFGHGTHAFFSRTFINVKLYGYDYHWTVEKLIITEKKLKIMKM